MFLRVPGGAEELLTRDRNRASRSPKSGGSGRDLGAALERAGFQKFSGGTQQPGDKHTEDE